MLSPQNSKTKYNKNYPHRHQNAKKAEVLDNIHSAEILADNYSTPATTLTKRKSDWMSEFTSQQQKIIQGELGKMMKTLKRKLTSPNKNINLCIQSLGNKTQRWNQGCQPTTAQQTMRKKAYTDRKSNVIKSPKPKTQRQNKLCSPTKRLRVNSSQVNSLNMKSPYKNKKVSKTVGISGASQEQKRTKIKTKKISQVLENQDNYLLVGDSFVKVDPCETQNIQSGIFLASSRSQKQQNNQKFIWKEFLEEKQKLSRESLQLSQNKTQTNFKSNEQNRQTSNLPSTTINQNKIQGLNLSVQENQFNQQDKNQANVFTYLSGDDSDRKETNQNKSRKSQESADLSEVRPYKQMSSDEDQIKARQKAINLQIKAQIQVLNRLLSNGKIDMKQHQEHMDLAIEMYDKQMTEIQNLKQLMNKNEQKVATLMQNTKTSLQISEKIDSQDPKQILQAVFGKYKKNITTKDVQQKKLEAEKEIQSNEQINDSFFRDFNENSPTKSQQSQEVISSTSLKIENPRINESAEQAVFIEQPDNKMKRLIDSRIAVQMGLNVNDSEGINTSMISIYQFITQFFYYLKTFHLEEFLAYVNMPYGYSVRQRLMFMQGYDEIEENDGIIYGLEEVIRPEILDSFHKSLYSQKKGYSNTLQSYEMIHNKSVFDCINESINKFRPYFEITGPPYPWTTSQKSLTLYLINQECVDEMMQKVRLQVLRWSSSLCGLIIPEATQRSLLSDIQDEQKTPLTIEQIFQKYTLETDCELLEQRESKVIKQQKTDTQESNFQWNFHDQFKTATLYEISACILEDLVKQLCEWL